MPTWFVTSARASIRWSSPNLDCRCRRSNGTGAPRCRARPSFDRGCSPCRSTKAGRFAFMPYQHAGIFLKPTSRLAPAGVDGGGDWQHARSIRRSARSSSSCSFASRVGVCRWWSTLFARAAQGCTIVLPRYLRTTCRPRAHAPESICPKRRDAAALRAEGIPFVDTPPALESRLQTGDSVFPRRVAPERTGRSPAGRYTRRVSARAEQARVSDDRPLRAPRRR